MGEVIVNMLTTLDGVIQAPARADEDPSSGFGHGGWAVPYSDEVMTAEAGKGMGHDSDLLTGHRLFPDDGTYAALVDLLWRKQQAVTGA
jgi:hypothetical protein